MSSQMSSQFQMLFVAHEQNAPNLAESRDDQLVLFNGLVVGAAETKPDKGLHSSAANDPSSLLVPSLLQVGPSSY